MQNKRKILIYGDSNTFGYDPADMYERRYPLQLRWTTILQERLQKDWVILPEGMNGRKLPDLRYDSRRIRNLMAGLTPDDIFAVMLGTNDILLTMDPDAGSAVRSMESFLCFLLESREPETILVIAPPHIGSSLIRDPLYRRYYEESLKMNEGFGLLSKKYKVRFADAGDWDIALSADLVHFSEEGHRQFAGKLEEFMRCYHLKE